MITYSIIQKSQLEGANRLDAEYYQPEYLDWLKQLNKFNLISLGELAQKIDVGFVSSMVNHFQETGIPLLRTQNVKEFYIDLESDLVYIGDDFHKKLKKTQIFPKDVLLARSGSIGDACVVPDNFPVTNSADIISIRSLKNINPEYLTAFLNSKYGKFQIERGSSGGLQGHINLFSLEKLLIPILDEKLQEEIKQKVLSGLAELENSKSFYSRAENLLLEELGLSSFAKAMENKEDLNWVVNLSEVKEANRMDAEYFQPKYERLIVKLKEHGSKLLPDVIENVSAKFNPTLQSEKIFKYVELADINSSIGMINGFSEVLGKEAPSRAKRILKNDDVIVSSVEGSLEKVALTDKNQEGYLASTGFFQFRSKVILPEVLLVLAKSIVLQMQLQKLTAGTILSAVPKETVKNILIPTLPKETQQKIADLVKKSHEARKKSKELLEEAKRKVEEMIEKAAC